jgi:hypothetical protein
VSRDDYVPTERESLNNAVDALRRIADAAESIAEELRRQRLERERAAHGEDLIEDLTDEEREALQVFTPPKGTEHG